MGEAAMSGGGGGDEGDVGGRGVVRWERFLPRTALRVLLVEADDSTRQAIETLLKKCSYKVAVVSDGLEAWEVLKGRPDSIDLVLMEEELPSISGFALLTLIMEHDSCKNTPVIMMSSNDSASMVYKCMLRGAADFLVKPVRKNELQNLWQHVWRRQAVFSLIHQSVSGGQGVPDEGMDHSNGACTPDNEECDERGSGAQSSCSAPDLEGAKDVMMIGQLEDPGRKKDQDNCNTFSEASDNNAAITYSSREARDLIGNFQNHSTESCINPSGTVLSKNDPCHRLDLSLGRYDDSKSNCGITVEERTPAVHQSNVSAFSRYKAVQPSKNDSSASHPNTQNRSLYQASGELRQGEVPFSSPQLKMPSVAVLEKGRRLDRTCTSYGSSIHPSYNNQISASQTPSPDSTGQREVLSRVIHVPDPNISSCSNQTALRRNMKFDTTEHMRNASVGNDRFQHSSLCNGTITRLNSFAGVSACGSNGSGIPSVEGIPKQDGNMSRSLQRETALTKFRQKRKDRCFEKKVRYENRKKLAEQRPRVKGQFVRQVPTDVSSTPTTES